VLFFIRSCTEFNIFEQLRSDETANCILEVIIALAVLLEPCGANGIGANGGILGDGGVDGGGTEGGGNDGGVEGGGVEGGVEGGGVEGGVEGGINGEGADGGGADGEGVDGGVGGGVGGGEGGYKKGSGGDDAGKERNDTLSMLMSSTVTSSSEERTMFVRLVSVLYAVFASSALDMII
jgi:hypothetical protein